MHLNELILTGGQSNCYSMLCYIIQRNRMHMNSLNNNCIHSISNRISIEYSCDIYWELVIFSFLIARNYLNIDSMINFFKRGNNFQLIK
jgi:hypothetical protein